MQERRLQLLELWQPALSPASVGALDLRHYMTSSLVCGSQPALHLPAASKLGLLSVVLFVVTALLPACTALSPWEQQRWPAEMLAQPLHTMEHACKSDLCQ